MNESFIKNACGIYIHVPFCAVKCPYCDFYSVKYSKSKVMEYADAVIRNLKNFDRNILVDSIYFGGGTPSLLPAEAFKRILAEIFQRFNISDAEITAEINPRTISKEKLKLIHEYGINRISAGIQSACDAELKALGRMHSYEDAEKIVMDAYDIGIENISCDLMLGIPYQTRDSLKESVEKLCGLPITHISAYMLKIEAGTPFGMSIPDAIADDDTVADMYLDIAKMLEKKEFQQYEISNFAKKGFICRHNMKYWECEEYIGIGPAAHSFYNGKRYHVPDDLNGFIQNDVQRIIVDDENPADFSEKVMLGLRLKKGIRLSGHPDMLKKAEEFEKNGWVSIGDDGTVMLTPKGFLISNYIIAEIIQL